MTCCSSKKDIKQRQIELKKIQKIHKETISRNSQNHAGFPTPHHPHRIPGFQQSSSFSAQDYDDEETEVEETKMNVKRNDSVNALDFFPFPTTDERPDLEHIVTNKYVCGVKGTYR